MHPAIGTVRSLVVDVAMGQIPRSTERISSNNNNNNNKSISIAQSKLSSVALTAVQTNKCLWSPGKSEVCKETDAERMLAGKLFHTTRPATAKTVTYYSENCHC